MADIVVVTVKPGSRKGPLVEVGDGGALTIYVRERAVDGRATEAASRLPATHLGVVHNHVELVSGATSRVKRCRLIGRRSLSAIALHCRMRRTAAHR